MFWSEWRVAVNAQVDAPLPGVLKQACVARQGALGRQQPQVDMTMLRGWVFL